MRSVISLGSNIGASKKNIELGTSYISEKCVIEAESKLMLTSPIGVTKQADFLNKIILINTELEPIMLLEFFKYIEVKVGRIKRARWCERELDIDIICYEGQIINSDVLTVPHKELLNRLFVLYGASLICPSYIVEGLDKSFLELYKSRKDQLSFQKLILI